MAAGDLPRPDPGRRAHPRASPTSPHDSPRLLVLAAVHGSTTTSAAVPFALERLAFSVNSGLAGHAVLVVEDYILRLLFLWSKACNFQDDAIGPFRFADIMRRTRSSSSTRSRVLVTGSLKLKI